MAVITLCGSTKFKPQFREAEAVLTMQGHIKIKARKFFRGIDFLPNILSVLIVC